MNNYAQELEYFKYNYGQLKHASGAVSREIYLALCHTHFLALLHANEQALCGTEAALADEIITTHKRRGTLPSGVAARWRTYKQLAKTNYDSVVDAPEHFIAALQEFGADMEVIFALTTRTPALDRQI